jgi:NAD(P)-dependent dehydrogenase (short-subunit alcohol dehydrogenase family)
VSAVGQPGAALVIGASGGIGAALVAALREEGRHPVIGLSRGSDPPIDLLREESIAAAATWIAGQGLDLSLVVIATGFLHDDRFTPERSWRHLDPEHMAQAFAVNAIGPALVLKHVLPLLRRDRRAVFAALSARVGSITDNRLGGWYGYRATKAALNQLIRTAAIEARRTNERAIIVGLHPGTVDTPLSRPFQANVPVGQLFEPDRAALQLLDVIEGLGVKDSGKIFDWQGAEIAP